MKSHSTLLYPQHYFELMLFVCFLHEIIYLLRNNTGRAKMFDLVLGRAIFDLSNALPTELQDQLPFILLQNRF